VFLRRAAARRSGKHDDLSRGAVESLPPAPHPCVMESTHDNPAAGATAQPPAPSSPLDFSRAAAAKVRELIREEGNPQLKLRVYIQGGGCSGFQYGFEFDELQGEDDLAIVTDAVTLLVDPLSLQYLMGAQVDYSESLHGAQFVIRNPNAKTTCGCGSSFTV
jgi:iron-sulfur cluster insertion protein